MKGISKRRNANSQQNLGGFSAAADSENKIIQILHRKGQIKIWTELSSLRQEPIFMVFMIHTQGEKSFEGDKLIEGGTFGEMSNGVHYREVRQYQTDYHLARFYFVTRCYSSYFESILADLAKEPKPDVVLLNSCLWDISR